MRISDWSSDVCSSDLEKQAGNCHGTDAARHRGVGGGVIDLGGRDVAHDPALSIFSLDAVDADIDAHGTSLDPIAHDQLRASRRGHDYIRRSASLGEIHCVPVALSEERGEGKESVSKGR